MKSKSNFINITLIDSWYRYLFVVSLTAYVCYLLIAINVKRYLYADGAQFFCNLLQGNFPVYGTSVNRLFVNFIQELPVKIFSCIFTDSINALGVVYGATLFFSNAFFILILWYLSRSKKQYNVFCVSLFLYTSVNMLSEIFIQNEILIAFWIFTILYFYSFSYKAINCLDVCVVVVCSLISFNSYENAILFFPVIFISTLLNKKNTVNKYDNYIKYILLLVTFFGFFYYLVSTLMFASGPARESYFPAFFYSLSISSNIYITLLAIVMLFSTYFSCWKKVLIIEFIIGVGVAIYGLLNIHWIWPAREVQYRVLIGLAGAIVYFVYSLIKYYGYNQTNISLNKYKCCCIISYIMILQCVWQLGNCYYWNEYSTSYKSWILSQNEKILSVADFNDYTGGKYIPYEWGWTEPLVGVVLVGSYNIDRVVIPQVGTKYCKIDNGNLILGDVLFRPKYFNWSNLLND